MSDCRFGVSPVNYPDPDPDIEFQHGKALKFYFLYFQLLFLETMPLISLK